MRIHRPHVNTPAAAWGADRRKSSVKPLGNGQQLETRPALRRQMRLQLRANGAFSPLGRRHIARVLEHPSCRSSARFVGCHRRPNATDSYAASSDCCPVHIGVRIICCPEQSTFSQSLVIRAVGTSQIATWSAPSGRPRIWRTISSFSCSRVRIPSRCLPRPAAASLAIFISSAKTGNPLSRRSIDQRPEEHTRIAAGQQIFMAERAEGSRDARPT